MDVVHACMHGATPLEMICTVQRCSACRPSLLLLLVVVVD
jgi:hypothetical protein